jgi:hypothetical protein
MSKKPDDSKGRRGLDPGPEIPDPSPWNGQVGEGATLPAGERLAHLIRELQHPEIIGHEEPEETKPEKGKH